MSKPVRTILASTSPRRLELLTAARIKFETGRPDTDETQKRGESPRALVRRLAEEKARSVLDAQVRPGRPGDERVRVIAADTIVVAPGGKRVLGKPRDRAEALKMISTIAGRTHEVLTGYCILDTGLKKPIVRVISTKVTMRKLSRAQVAAYVDAGESMDKAGAYGAQGLGMTLIQSIRGSYTNVVGLPIAEVIADLESIKD